MPVWPRPALTVTIAALAVAVVLSTAAGTSIAIVAGSAALALAMLELLRASDVPLAWQAASWWTIPVVLLGTSLPGTLSTALVLIALTAALRRRHLAMLVGFGVAVAIDLQAAIAAPLFVALLIGGRLRWRWWLVAPTTAGMVMALTGPPAHSDQPGWSGYFGELAGGAPNLWTIAAALVGPLAPGLTALALATTIGTATAFVAWASTRQFARRDLIAAALLAMLAIAGLLPRVGADMFFLPAILALVLAVVRRDRKGWSIAALVAGGAVMAATTSSGDLPTIVGAIAMLLATAKVAQLLLAPAANDNPLPAGYPSPRDAERLAAYVSAAPANQRLAGAIKGSVSVRSLTVERA